MMPGDVVLTPNWCWHGHGNDSRANAYWLDVLDVPLVHLLEPMFFEPHPDEFEKETVVANASPMHFSWADTERRLAEAAVHSNGQPAEIALGDPALDTMALTMIELKAKQATTARKIYRWSSTTPTLVSATSPWVTPSSSRMRRCSSDCGFQPSLAAMTNSD